MDRHKIAAIVLNPINYIASITFLFSFFFLCISCSGAVDTVNIRQFGAQGNGSSDDTKAFRVAINALNPGEVLYIPRGVYLLKMTLTINTSDIQIVGEGNESQLKFQGPKYSVSKELLYGFMIQDAKNIVFKNFSIDGGASNYKNLIYDSKMNQTWDVDGAYHLFFIHPKFNNSVSNITFENVLMSNSFFDAIHTYGRLDDSGYKYRTSGLIVNDCSFISIGGHGIGLNNVSKSIIKNSEFKNVGLNKMTKSKFGSGLAVDASAGCEEITVENNIVDGAGGGFKSESHVVKGKVNYSRNIHFIGNTIKNLYKGPEYQAFYGIKLNGLNCSAVGNTIESFQHGILIGINSSKNLVYRNNILGTSAFDAAGIRCDESGGGHLISENYIVNTGAQGILIANSNNLKVVKNVVGISRLENIRVAGGRKMSINDNILFDSGSNNISIAPVGGMKISEIIIDNNLFFNVTMFSQPKGIFSVGHLFSNKNNVIMKKAFPIRSTFGDIDLSTYKVGDIIINDEFDIRQKLVVGWRVVNDGGVKKLKNLGYNEIK